MSKISNVITMMNLLSTGRKYSVKELSQILEVTPRMVRIYKEELEKSGIYIDTIMGTYGGYVLNNSIRVPERKFRTEDYEILDRYIEKEDNPEIKLKMELLKDKIRGVYFGSKQEKNDLKLTDDILSKYNCLARAIKERRKVRIVYYSIGKGDLERVIDPIELFLFRDEWQCSAFCEMRQDFRHFELKRIKSFELLTEKY